MKIKRSKCHPSNGETWEHFDETFPDFTMNQEM